MKDIISNAYLRMAWPLLCFFVLIAFGCSSLKNVNNSVYTHPNFILQIVVKESDFSRFNEQIQQLGLVAEDFQPARINSQNGEIEGYWITFRFLNRRSYLTGSSAIMSTGVAHQISYQY